MKRRRAGRTRALALVAKGRFETLEIDLPEPGPSDLLVRPVAVGLCGTDFHIASGEANYNLAADGRARPLSEAPQILGHEIVAEVLEAGPEALGIIGGQRVLLDQGLNCKSQGRKELCLFCRVGVSHQCEHYEEFGITGLPGGFSDEMVVPAVNAIPIQSERSSAECALSEPLACILHTLSVLRAATQRYHLVPERGQEPVHSILITGAGPAGLLLVQALRRILSFQGLILVSDPHPKKRALAEKLGALTFDPAEGSLQNFVREATFGRLAEVLIDASGSARAIREFPSLLRKQGTVVKYGIGFKGASLELLNELQWKEATLLLPVGASSSFDEDGRPTLYREALAAIETGLIEAAPLLTHRYKGLESIGQAFSSDHRREDFVKGVVERAHP